MELPRQFFMISDMRAHEMFGEGYHYDLEGYGVVEAGSHEVEVV